MVDSRFIGWAMSGQNAIRARAFTKSEMAIRTLWPEWETVTKLADAVSVHRSLWPEGIYQPIAQPGIHQIAKGYSGCGDDPED